MVTPNWVSHSTNGFELKGPSGKFCFDCSLTISDGKSTRSTRGTERNLQDKENGLHAENSCLGVTQKVIIQQEAGTHAFSIFHHVENSNPYSVWIHDVQTVHGTYSLEPSDSAPSFLHALNVKRGNPAIQPLEANTPSDLLGRASYVFFEGLLIRTAPDQPALVTGALTQHIVHRSQQLTWDGQDEITLDSWQDLRGIERKEIQPGGSLALDGVFIQFIDHGDPNIAFEDYLRAIKSYVGTRWDLNRQRKELFFVTWNNFLYWHIDQTRVEKAFSSLANHLPAVRWAGLDDGYQLSSVTPELEKNSDGFIHDDELEREWWLNCPGVGFAFSTGDGENTKNFPQGILHTADNIREAGLRPVLWVGMQIGKSSPAYTKHPEWYHAFRGDLPQCLDVSRAEVREEITQVFKRYYGEGKYEGLKLDFWSNSFEHPAICFTNPEKTAAEWRAWFFDMLRSCLPEEGLISLGCNISAGSTFLAPWVDSVRHSNDMRDGNWETVLGNVKLSIIPLLTHGHHMPICDADSLAIYRGLTENERQSWADYAYVTGSLMEFGGDPEQLTDEDIRWLNFYFDNPCAGQRVWFADPDCWERDALPNAVMCADPSQADHGFLLSLHNWTENTLIIQQAEWCKPASHCTTYEDVRNPSMNGSLSGATFSIPPRSNQLIRVR